MYTKQENKKTRKQAYYSVFEYIEGFYNTNRRHSHLRYLTIKEFNEQHKFNNKKNSVILFALICPKNSCRFNV